MELRRERWVAGERGIIWRKQRVRSFKYVERQENPPWVKETAYKHRSKF